MQIIRSSRSVKPVLRIGWGSWGGSAAVPLRADFLNNIAPRHFYSFAPDRLLSRSADCGLAAPRHFGASGRHRCAQILRDSFLTSCVDADLCGASLRPPPRPRRHRRRALAIGGVLGRIFLATTVTGAGTSPQTRFIYPLHGHARRAKGFGRRGRPY